MMLAVSAITREVNYAFLMIGGVCLLLLAGVTVTMVAFVIRYRRSKARTTSQVGNHTLLEITWTTLPTLIVLWMFFVGYQGFGLIRSVPADAMVVEVTARQWFWSFHYPDANIDSNVLVVPVDTDVVAQLTAPANEVLHGFFIPDFRVKQDVIPGRKTHLWFRGDRVGTHDIFCSQFCGQGHSGMLSQLRIVSRQDFARWVQGQQMAKYQPLVFEAIVNPNLETFGPKGLNIASKALFLTFCASCHGPAGDGSGLRGQARDFTRLDGWKRSPKVTDICRTLTEGMPGSQMRPFLNLTPWERVALAHYVRYFLKTSPLPDTKTDYDALVKDYALDKIQLPKQPLPIEQAMKLLVEERRSQSATTAP